MYPNSLRTESVREGCHPEEGWSLKDFVAIGVKTRQKRKQRITRGPRQEGKSSGKQSRKLGCVWKRLLWKVPARIQGRVLLRRASPPASATTQRLIGCTWCCHWVLKACAHVRLILEGMWHKLAWPLRQASSTSALWLLWSDISLGGVGLSCGLEGPWRPADLPPPGARSTIHPKLWRPEVSPDAASAFLGEGALR